MTPGFENEGPRRHIQLILTSSMLGFPVRTGILSPTFRSNSL